MHSVYALLLVATLVLFLGRVNFHPDRWPLWVQVLFQSGMIYMLLGPAIGPAGLGLMQAESFSLLDPLLNLLMAWVGLVFGLQLKIRDLKRIQRADWQLSILQYLLAVLACLLPALFLFTLQPALSLRAPVVLALAAGTSSATVIAIILQDLGLTREKLARSALMSANLDNLYALIALIVLGVLAAHSHPLTSRLPLPVALASPILLSMLMAWTFHYFLRRGVRESQFALLLAGLITFAGGLSALMDLSPLAMGLMIGFWLANQSREAHHLYSFMVAHERPVFLGLILMAGLFWQPSLLAGWTSLLLLPLMLVRLLAKRQGWLIAGRSTPSGEEGAGTLHWLLLPMGGLPLAMALSELQLHPESSGPLVLGLIVPFVLFSVLLSAWLGARRTGGRP
jgi:Kef-type K+ transport system membrane component KefB